MQHLEFRKQSISNIHVNPKLLGLAVVEINPTELCNRTCSFCPRHDASIYPNRNLHMSAHTAEVLSHQLSTNKFQGYVCIAGYGEPLLNPNIKSIIERLNPHYLELITNADPVLKNKYTFDELFVSGVRRVMISDYDSNPVFSELEKQNPNIHVRRYVDDGQDHYEEYGFNNRAGTMFSIDKPIARQCYIPSYKVMIDWNGDVLLCSHDWTKKTVFGNIHRLAINEIWMSHEFIQMRIELTKGNRALFEQCSKCNVIGNIMGKEYAEYFL